MVGILFVLAGLCSVAYACWNLRPAYHVYRGDTDDVLSIERAEGPVELEGTAGEIDGAGTVRAPLTDAPCLAYEYEVEELQSSGKNSSWNTVDEGSGRVPFRLEDDTASVRVDPAGATLALETDRTFEVDGGDPEPDPVEKFLEQESDLESADGSLDLGIVELSTGNDRRYHERRLEPGGEAYVLGQSRYDVEARETMRDISAVVEDGTETPVFVVSDSSQVDASWILLKPPLPWLAVGLFVTVLGVLLTL